MADSPEETARAGTKDKNNVNYLLIMREFPYEEAYRFSVLYYSNSVHKYGPLHTW